MYSNVFLTGFLATEQGAPDFGDDYGSVDDESELESDEDVPDLQGPSGSESSANVSGDEMESMEELEVSELEEVESSDSDEAEAEMEMMNSLKRKLTGERAGSPKKQKVEQKKPEAKKPEPKHEMPEGKHEKKHEAEKKPEAEKKEVKEPAAPKVKKLPSGLQYEDIIVGTGPKAKKGKRVSVRCT
jgi:FK506-binding nuclear protein